MRARVWIAALLAALMVGGGFVLQRRTADLCLETETLVRQGMNGGGEAALRQAEDRWQAAQPYLAAMITHDRLDAVSESLARAWAFFQAGEEKELLAELAAALRQLEHIREYDRVSVKTLL